MRVTTPRHLFARRCIVTEHQLQTVRPHAEWIGAIDNDLAREIAEALHRGFSRQPRCRKDDSLGISGRYLRREKPLARQRIVFGIGGIGHAENHVLSSTQPAAAERRAYRNR